MQFPTRIVMKMTKLIFCIIKQDVCEVCWFKRTIWGKSLYRGHGKGKDSGVEGVDELVRVEGWMVREGVEGYWFVSEDLGRAWVGGGGLELRLL